MSTIWPVCELINPWVGSPPLGISASCPVICSFTLLLTCNFFSVICRERGCIVLQLLWLCRGHGTYVNENQLCASVAGVIERVNRLISVHPYKSRSVPCSLLYKIIAWYTCYTCPTHVVQWSNHLGAMCSRGDVRSGRGSIRASARARPPTKKELFQIIPVHMMTREIISDRKTEGSTVSSINCDRSCLI